MTSTVLKEIDNKMNIDNEATAKELKVAVENSTGISLSERTLLGDDARSAGRGEEPPIVKW